MGKIVKMANNYWIKLYHEILRDPKMARLPDRVWRRTIELFLLAGEIGKNGTIGNTDDIAWALRVSLRQFEKDIAAIEEAGIVKRDGNGWLVVNFEKRNAPVTGAERVRRHRNAKRNESVTEVKRECNESVTKNGIDTDTDTDTDKEADKDTESDAEADGKTRVNAQNIPAAFENPYLPLEEVLEVYRENIGNINGHTNRLKNMTNLYGGKYVVEAIRYCVIRNKLDINYLQGTLKGWRMDGKI